METKFQTSFIPKKPIQTTSANVSGGMSLFLLLSIIIFLISLGMAGFVFFEKNFLVQQISSDQSSIATNKNGLVSDSNTVESLVLLDSRINVANTLLAKHISVYPIFDFIQKATLQNVRFKDFNFAYAGQNSSGANQVSIKMSGQAKDWETVASQADQFGLPDYKNVISQPKVNNLTLNADGSISFTFDAYVSPDSLIYKNTNN